MILGVGTDIVKVSRFDSWKNFNKKQLLHIFTEKELEDCSRSSNSLYFYNTECLASRFAAKEAFFKALSSSLVKLHLTQKTFSFMFACKNVEIIKTTWGIPTLKINWEEFEKKINNKISNLQTELSISHEKNYAISFVIISKKC